MQFVLLAIRTSSTARGPVISWDMMTRSLALASFASVGDSVKESSDKQTSATSLMQESVLFIMHAGPSSTALVGHHKTEARHDASKRAMPRVQWAPNRTAQATNRFKCFDNLSSRQVPLRRSSVENVEVLRNLIDVIIRWDSSAIQINKNAVQ
jgi:hypothetical protein